MLSESENLLACRLKSIEHCSNAFPKWIELREEYRNAIQNASGAPSLPISEVRMQSKHALQNASSYEEQVTALRIAYRCRLLEIALADSLAENSVENPADIMPEVSENLADLASVTLECALDILCERFGFKNPEFAIIAFGKTGAHELNYISDVDLVYIASEEFITNGNAQKLATGVSEVIYGTVGSEPGLWEVDTALRPEGKQGPLVRTISSTKAYYEKWAVNWEFQALLKASFVAGNAKLGAEYEAMASEFIWSAASRPNFVKDCQAMRQRVIDNIPAGEKDKEIKLGAGGLRDVEFTVQLLQLVHGRSDGKIRAKNTLIALQELCDNGYIGRADAREMIGAYRFLRALEHRVQMLNMTRTHLFPTDNDIISQIASAWKMSADEFTAKWRKTRLRVKELHQEIYFRPMLQSLANLSPEEIKLESSVGLERLNSLGFDDSAAAQGHISALTKGASRKSMIMRQILPTFLSLLADSANPTRALLNFRRISETIGDAPWFLAMLRDNSEAAEKLAMALANSEYLANAMIEYGASVNWLNDNANLEPRALKDIVTEFEATIERTTNLEEVTKKLLRIRERELLRLAFSFAILHTSSGEIAKRITELTDLVVDKILDLVNADQATDLVAIAMGRYGGQEMGFSSDADLVLVSWASGADLQKSVSSAQLFKKLVTQSVWQSALSLSIDFDLRPEGKQGTLVRSVASYDEYYEKFADIWEFQALLRARVVGEHPELSAVIDRHRYRSKGLNAQKMQEVRLIKARVENERGQTSTLKNRLDLKLGPGGLSDIEWLTQIWQMQFASSEESLRTDSTLLALTAMAKIHSKILSNVNCEILNNAWRRASELRNASVLVAFHKGYAGGNANSADYLNNDGAYLQCIAKVLGEEPELAHEIYDNYAGLARKARAIFEELF